MLINRRLNSVGLALMHLYIIHLSRYLHIFEKGNHKRFKIENDVRKHAKTELFGGSSSAYPCGKAALSLLNQSVRQNQYKMCYCVQQSKHFLFKKLIKKQNQQKPKITIVLFHGTHTFYNFNTKKFHVQSPSITSRVQKVNMGFIS